jgi:hypothetical protein
VDDVCVDKAQFKQLLASAGIATTTSLGTETPVPNGDTEAPVITLQGNNPANIELNSIYADLGASVSDNVDSNLGVKVSVDGEQWLEVGNLSLNTASSTTYILTFRAIDNAGNVGTTTRMVIVGEEEGAVVEEETLSEPVAEGSTATTTPQS